MRSIAASKSAWRMYWAPLRPARIAASLQRFARSAPVSPEVCRAMQTEIDVERQRLAARVHAEDRLAPRDVRRRHVHLPVEAAGAKQRRDRDPGAGSTRP